MFGATSTGLSQSNPLAESIRKWAVGNAEKLYQAYSFKGGWEGWAQIELAIALQQEHGGQASYNQNMITREDTVYDGTKQRCDILLTTCQGGVPKWYNFIELKCESSGMQSKFVGEVEADFAKVANGMAKKNLRPCTAFVCAISVSPECGTELAAKKPAPVQISLGGTMNLWMWWSVFKVG
jgi:hypothetical protein